MKFVCVQYVSEGEPVDTKRRRERGIHSISVERRADVGVRVYVYMYMCQVYVPYICVYNAFAPRLFLTITPNHVIIHTKHRRTGHSA